MSFEDYDQLRQAIERRLIDNFELNFPCTCGLGYDETGSPDDPVCDERHEFRMWLWAVASFAATDAARPAPRRAP